MGVLQILLLVLYVLVAVALIWVVILQEPKTGGGDLFGGSTDLFAARGLTGGLYRLTIYLGLAFLALALFIGTWQL